MDRRSIGACRGKVDCNLDYINLDILVCDPEHDPEEEVGRLTHARTIWELKFYRVSLKKQS
jgi:hypothetical protein